MSSQRKIDSSRANGAQSHGPVTEEGRERSSMNALKYGLTARTVVLPNEDDDQYTSLLDSYVQHLQPIGPVEMDLVLDMVNAKWRQRRFSNIESGLFEREMKDYEKQIAAARESYSSVEHVVAFQSLSNYGCLPMLNRMESRSERTYSRALRTLLQLRRLREIKSEKRTQSQERPLEDPLGPHSDVSDVNLFGWDG